MHESKHITAPEPVWGSLQWRKQDQNLETNMKARPRQVRPTRLLKTENKTSKSRRLSPDVASS